MKAAIYVRVSTEEQRERQTIATQREFAERYCQQHEIRITSVYADDGVSGTIPLADRPEGRRLLEDARRGNFDTVLIYRLDRMGRDALLILKSVSELEALGIQVRSMTESFDQDPTGKFLMTILSGVAGLERATIIQRMVEGTNRMAREGAWIGGCVAFGYRREGKGRDARLVISETPMPGLTFSEADVIRLIYRMAGDEKRSCTVIAAHLNRLGIPPAYQLDGHSPGKRRRTTAGIWYPGRIRNMIVNTTYRGFHQYGIHSRRPRELIDRQVPAIVDEASWQRAQATLQTNRAHSPRNTRRKYLLRSLIKCGLCGHTYCGNAHWGSKVFYVCNGKRAPAGTFGRHNPCRSKTVPGVLEEVVWQDIEAFLRNPGPVLEELTKRLKEGASETMNLRKEAGLLEKNLRGKEGERDRVLGLYRRQRIDDATLDQQLDQIERERTGLQEALQGLQGGILAAEETEGQVQSAEALLRRLHERLDERLSWEVKRELVETLVEGIRVDTLIESTNRQAVVTVNYRFNAPEANSSIATSMGRGSWLP